MNSFFLQRAGLLVALAASCFEANSATIKLQPIADTSLAEVSPDNNLGGTAFVNAGTAGVNASGARNRGLFQFDFGSIPANSRITSASLQLEVVFQPGNPESSSFALHRMLRSWGEGSQDSTANPSPGIGIAAITNEATWNAPFAFINTWSSPGADGNFNSTVSSRASVFGLADFPLFPSTTEMISDAQMWLDNPAMNFGWMLKTESEEIFYTARRFGSREFTAGDVNSPPYLEIEFVPPLSIRDPHVNGGQFLFAFSAAAGQGYVVEFKNALATTNSWQTLTNVSAPVASTDILVSDVISTNARFYRVIAP